MAGELEKIRKGNIANILKAISAGKILTANQHKQLEDYYEKEKNEPKEPEETDLDKRMRKYLYGDT